MVRLLPMIFNRVNFFLPQRRFSNVCRHFSLLQLREGRRCFWFIWVETGRLLSILQYAAPTPKTYPAPNSNSYEAVRQSKVEYGSLKLKCFKVGLLFGKRCVRFTNSTYFLDTSYELFCIKAQITLH